jgi:hypothetical protein
MRRSVQSGAPWETIARYSRAVRVGDTIHVAGTTAQGPNGELVGAGDLRGVQHELPDRRPDARPRRPRRGWGRAQAGPDRHRVHDHHRCVEHAQGDRLVVVTPSGPCMGHTRRSCARDCRLRRRARVDRSQRHGHAGRPIAAALLVRRPQRRRCDRPCAGHHPRDPPLSGVSECVMRSAEASPGWPCFRTRELLQGPIVRAATRSVWCHASAGRLG